MKLWLSHSLEVKLREIIALGFGGGSNRKSVKQGDLIEYVIKNRVKQRVYFVVFVQ